MHLHRTIYDIMNHCSINIILKRRSIAIIIFDGVIRISIIFDIVILNHYHSLLIETI